MNETRYGMVGWEEFASNRTGILAKYDASKSQTVSRPVRTDHGQIGEAAIREWLQIFLPQRYRVTSGFIIPDVVQTLDYRLYHYDVIVFDALNAPILWMDPNPDQTEQGKKRAIPARYVHSVIEVKAAFGVQPAKDALQKLRELNKIASHLSPNFSCSVVFIELPDALSTQGRLLRHLLPKPPIHGFRGGIIMRCAANANISGTITLAKNDGSPGLVQDHPNVPLVKDTDKFNIYLNKEGACVMAEPFGGAKFIPYDTENFVVSKTYGPSFCEGDVCVVLEWSNNGFSQFALDMLYYLEGGIETQRDNYRFGQIFDYMRRLE